MKPDRKQAGGFESALEHHRAGRLQQAEAIYRKLLEKTPDHEQASFLLGALCLASQRWEEALSRSQRAAALAPTNAHYLSNWGEALRRLGHLEQAAEVLVRAAALRPDLPEASFNLGMALAELGETEAALTCLVRAADVAPERYETQYRLARGLKDAGDPARAVPHYQAALALSPKSLDALLELSAALRNLKRSDGAVAMARRAVAVAPSSALARCELARALAAHERGPDLAEAITHYQAAIELESRLVDAHFGLGSALVDVGELSAGIRQFKTVLRLDPKHAVASSNVAYLSVFDPEASPESARAAAEDWALAHALPIARRIVPPKNAPSPERRLRVGLLGIFQDHATALFLAPLLKHYDRERMQLFGYALNPRLDAVSDSQREQLEELRDIATLSDSDVAALIRNDGIDVLVDFNMHMASSRLRVAAEKPAPVQVCWLAYPGTTGLKAIDYRITDDTMDPEGASYSLYTERALRLPAPFWCYDPRLDGPALSTLPALEKGYVTFGSLNAFWKTNPYLFGLWSEVLAAVPGSRFLLHAPDVETERRALAAFAKHEIESSRIQFLPRRPRPDFLAAHSALDIGLDTLPYTGHTTTLDALWMGVPVITLVGKTAAGRMGLSVMLSVNLPELATETEAEFVAQARRMSSDLASLAELRGNLRNRLRSSNAMDGARFARHFEAGLRSTWRTWCESATR